MTKLWGSAFENETLEKVIKFTAGRDVYGKPPADYTLLPYDLWVNKAHCVMLCKQKIITPIDAQVILQGLLEIDALVQKNAFYLDPQKEDTHTNIESWLIEKYGITHAGKLHTARSRNDQIITDMRLYMKDQMLFFTKQLLMLSEYLLTQAEKYKAIVMPGFTHHQHATVSTVGHFFLSFASMTIRDTHKCVNWLELYNINPLGNTFSYGTTFPIDQTLTSKCLGFNLPEYNSLDLVTNRGEPEVDIACMITTFMNHMSLLAQTLIVFSTTEFEMIKLHDAYTTGSSIMPQKKNPDVLEVIKAKASLASGLLQSLLGIAKANFIGYNRDSQWTKYIIMDLFDESLAVPEIVNGLLKTMEIHEEKMKQWCTKGFIGTTTVLEQIVFQYKVPFRKAKIIVEKAIKYSKSKDLITYDALDQALTEEQSELPVSPEQLSLWQSPAEIILLMKSIGSPGIESTEKSIEHFTKEIAVLKMHLKKKEEQKLSAIQYLNSEIEKIILVDKRKKPVILI